MQKFEQFGLNPAVLQVLKELGYETPTPVQEQSIPALLKGNDILAQAQTGTGKTAAFALPIIQQLDVENKHPQALILAPTRELAIQVAESFHSYTKNIPDFYVAPIYGGQDYRGQLKALKRGIHVVVGTPGRVMDHMRRETLSLKHLKIIVLDEADEMLKMGFIDDIKWILEQIPGAHQTALFSATMPTPIRKVADKYLKNPINIHIKSKDITVSSIKQYYTMVSKEHKLDALTRFLEVENCDGTIIFTRTKTVAAELAEKLEARGHAAAALHGDMNQSAREKVLGRLKKNSLDIIVATDVAARGLDVERLSHVINYDIPHDSESYIHRIGRTGRAGREGKALLFVTPRERNMLRSIEREIKQTLMEVEPPTLTQISQQHKEAFIQKIINIVQTQDLDRQRAVVEHLAHDGEYSIADIAAALVFITQGGNKSQQKKFGDQDKLKPLNEGFNTSYSKPRARGSRTGGSRERTFHGKSEGRSREGGSRERTFRGKSEGGSREGGSRERTFRGKSEGKQFSSPKKNFKSRNKNQSREC